MVGGDAPDGGAEGVLRVQLVQAPGEGGASRCGRSSGRLDCPKLPGAGGSRAHACHWHLDCPPCHASVPNAGAQGREQECLSQTLFHASGTWADRDLIGAPCSQGPGGGTGHSPDTETTAGDCTALWHPHTLLCAWEGACWCSLGAS